MTRLPEVEVPTTPCDRLLWALRQDPSAVGPNLPERRRIHGIGPLLFYHAQAEGRLADFEDLPLLKRDFMFAQLRSQQMAEALTQVLVAAQAAGVDVMVLKGAHLAAHVYATAALRPMGDIDLLIHREAREPVGLLLERLGYRPHGPADGYHQAFASSPELGVRIEIHWGLGAEHTSWALPLEEIWQDSVEAHFGEASARVMSPQHLPLYLVFHLAKHGFHAPLRALWDLEVCGLSPEHEPLAERWGLSAAHQIALGALRVFDPTRAPEKHTDEVLRRVLNYHSDAPPALEQYFQASLWGAAKRLLAGLDPNRPDYSLAGIVRRLSGGTRFLLGRLTDSSLRRQHRRGYQLERRLGLHPEPSALWCAKLEAWLGLVLARVALKTIGAMWILRRFDLEHEPSPSAEDDPRPLLEALNWAIRRLPGRTLCLPRSLVLCCMLRRRGMGGKVVFGARRHQGAFQAHAWVTREGRSLDDGTEAGMAPFRPNVASPSSPSPAPLSREA
jgi:hypothetical protein